MEVGIISLCKIKICHIKCFLAFECTHYATYNPLRQAQKHSVAAEWCSADTLLQMILPHIKLTHMQV